MECLVKWICIFIFPPGRVGVVAGKGSAIK
jgi:hypothetical protein